MKTTINRQAWTMVCAVVAFAAAGITSSRADILEAKDWSNHVEEIQQICCLADGVGLLAIRHLLALRLSRAREAFDCFYVGTGSHRFEQHDPALARFARENPNAHRIAVRSIVADQKASAAEHERQMDAYAKAMKRALA